MSSSADSDLLQFRNIRNGDVNWLSKTYIMGIVNVTPDSFSGDGVVNSGDAVRHAISQRERGADILDIGAESTRPGATPVDLQTELSRLLPVIGELRKNTDAVISIDTSKPEVIRQGLTAGADLVNVVDPEFPGVFDILSEYRPPVVIMHNRVCQRANPLDEICSYLHLYCERLVNAGLPETQIIIDPGFGFRKTPDQNIAILKNLRSLVKLGFTTLLGASRKSTIGKLIDMPVDHREFGSAAVVALAIEAGVNIVRVHDVSATRSVARVCDAVRHDWRPKGWPAPVAPL